MKLGIFKKIKLAICQFIVLGLLCPNPEDLKEELSKCSDWKITDSVIERGIMLLHEIVEKIAPIWKKKTWANPEKITLVVEHDYFMKS